MIPYFDGHLHSTVSDGNLTPEALVDAVHKAGVEAMALTDHDTFGGHARAEARCLQLGLRFVPGVEMSVDLGGREIHVLAYFVGREHTALCAALDAALAARRAHLTRALAKLATLGFALTENEVLAQVKGEGEAVGRPHIAKAMHARGLVKSVDDAFKRFLGNGRPGHLPRAHVSAETMIGLVTQAGGVCSAAHPGIYDLGATELEMLTSYGMKGVEVYHHEHEPGDLVYYLREAERLGLVPTGGSDFHAAPDRPRVRPGVHGLNRASFERLEAARMKS